MFLLNIINCYLDCHLDSLRKLRHLQVIRDGFLACQAPGESLDARDDDPLYYKAVQMSNL